MSSMAAVEVIAVGIGATLMTDLWNLFLKRVFGMPSLNFCFLGRWILTMPDGTFRHDHIMATPEKAFECPLGWVAHYMIGIALAVAFIGVVSPEWLAEPSLISALLFGVGTVIFPMFVMQPAFGLGMAASKTPNPAQARLKSLMTHCVYGLGLWGCALGVRFVEQTFRS